MTTTQTPDLKIVPRTETVTEVIRKVQDMPELIRRHVTDDQICVLTFDRPDSAANIFDKATLVDLNNHINFVMCDSIYKGLVVAGAEVHLRRGRGPDAVVHGENPG